MKKTHGVMTVAAVFLLALSAGCGGRDLPELAPVEGTVTLDGKPLPNVMVQFLPENGGRPSTGTTNDEGHYELTYVAGEMGARLGRNKVEVVMIWPDGEPTPGVKDPVPKAYKGAETTLSYEVKADDNVYDITMTSGGKP